LVSLSAGLILLSSPTALQELLLISPEWQPILRSLAGEGKVGLFDLFVRLGAQAIYLKAVSLKEERGRFLILVRDGYLQVQLAKMLGANQNLRRFWVQRHMVSDQQSDHVLSFSVELAQKMEGVLIKHLNQSSEDGYKVLLPAYIQRTVHNAVIDYIRQESAWERQTLQDLNLDPEQDDPRMCVADDLRYAPEALAISREQTGQLNQLRRVLESMLADASLPREPLLVIDCIFGLGLTNSSSPGLEMTMRECCDKLKITGETQARRIARCQVLLDKGLSIVREQVRDSLPGIVECWQGELNVNSASRRELSQQLGMTETEIDRLIKGRQYASLDELVDQAIVKPSRIKELASAGAVAAFVPVDLNQATVRDMIDILGLAKEEAQRLASERPFTSIGQLVSKGLIKDAGLDQILKRGAVLKTRPADARRIDLNRAELKEILAAGVPEAVAELAARGRPFATWSELDDFLCCDPPTWAVLRQKFCLGLIPG